MLEFHPYSFEATVTIRDFGKYHYVCVTIPPELEPSLPFGEYPRLRVKGELAGYDFEGAWQPQKGGPRWLMVPKDIMKAAKLEIGDSVRVAFGIADQDAVHVPEILADALSEAGLDAAWERLTAGKRRGYCYIVEKAKAPATKQKRILNIISELEA